MKQGRGGGALVRSGHGWRVWFRTWVARWCANPDATARKPSPACLNHTGARSQLAVQVEMPSDTGPRPRHPPPSVCRRPPSGPPPAPSRWQVASDSMRRSAGGADFSHRPAVLLIHPSAFILLPSAFCLPMSPSPMMQQYLDAKAACPDAVLLFRMGDFYELFHDDAKTAARVLNLALTSREKGAGAIPMAGFPHHQLESYLGKLIAAGLRAAVCEQVEDPKQAKGLVKRELTRIVSAGTVTDDALLDPAASNYLAAVVPPSAAANGKASPAALAAGVAWIDLSTGRFQAACFPPARLADELARIAPAECLLADDGGWEIPAAAGRTLVTRRPGWAFGLQAAGEALARHFGTHSLEGFGFGDDSQPAIRAAGAVLDYLVETQKSSLAHIDRLEHYSAAGRLEIDESTRRSLEITRTLRDGSRQGSLLAVLDRTATAMGSRMLADWLANPLADKPAIDARLDAVAELVDDARLTAGLVELLRGVYDLERLLARVTTGRASPRDLCFVGRTLAALPTLKAKITARRSTLLAHFEAELDLCPDVRGALERALADECPLASREGGFIRPGFNTQLDALRDLATGGKQWIAAYQAQEAARSGIASLKVGFNKVFGYYIEITNTHMRQDPGRVHPQADRQERRALRHARAERVRRKSPLRRRASPAARIRAVSRTARRGGRGRPAAASHGRGAGPARRAGRPGRSRPQPPLLPAHDRGRARAGNRRGPPSGARRPAGRRHVRAQRHRGRRPVGHDPADHRPEHGRQEHLYPPGGARHAAGPDRQLRSGGPGYDRPGRPAVRPRRRQRRTGPGPEHVHGRDDRNGPDPEPGQRAQPGDPRRNRPRHQHLRRAVAGLERGRAPARPRRLPHPVCHALSRADGAGRFAAERAEL